MGDRIRREVLGEERAGYGEKIVATLSQQLVADFGRGFELTNLTRMMKFAESFPDPEIVATLSQRLSWSHFRELLPLSQPLQREFYAEMSRVESWSVRTLRGRIDSMLYERTALSRKPDELAQQDLALLRRPWRGRPCPGSQRSLRPRLPRPQRSLPSNGTSKTPILRELELFLLELGAGFSFVARQKRIQLDGEDFYIDLLLYNRKLKRLVALDLKQGSFRAEYKGQMELYLRWLAKYEKEKDEESPPRNHPLCWG